MIIVPISGPSMEEAALQITSSARYADLFELRLDLITSPDIARLISLTRKPVIATCRPVREGGAFERSEDERIALLGRAIDAGARYVDLEYDAWKQAHARLASRGPKVQWIVSHHIFNGPPRKPEALYTKLRDTGADIVKIAYMANDAWQIASAVKILRCARRDRRKAIVIAMGEAGEASRILYRILGSWATFASPETGRGSAPGQLPASVMRNVLRVHQRSSKTKVYGLVGNPVGQSKGIYIHNPIYRRLGKDAIYCRFKIDNLRRFMKAFDGILAGCSVTTPHKQAMLKFLRSIDPLAKTLGAVNSVVRRGNGYFGANTDAYGALDAIEERVKVRGKKFVVLGAGGAARAIAGEASRRGAEVIVVNRTPARARKLASALHVQWATTDRINALKPEILANATSVGMWPDVNVSPLPSIPSGVRLAFDAIYNPPVTKFLDEARARGAAIVTGDEMYVRQAVEQIRILIGKKPRVSEVSRLFKAASHA
jgi:3-dehydroquinate dehydratase / shikimate dehydrogenase